MCEVLCRNVLKISFSWVAGRGFESSRFSSFKRSFKCFYKIVKFISLEMIPWLCGVYGWAAWVLLSMFGWWWVWTSTVLLNFKKAFYNKLWNSKNYLIWGVRSSKPKCLVNIIFLGSRSWVRIQPILFIQANKETAQPWGNGFNWNFMYW